MDRIRNATPRGVRGRAERIAARIFRSSAVTSAPRATAVLRSIERALVSSGASPTWPL